MPETFFTAWEAAERTPDPCARKHGGNANSVAAFDRLLPDLKHQQQQVYRYIVSQGMKGATVKEIARFMGHPGEVHRYSGRLTELGPGCLGLIVNHQSVRRESCAVWVAKEVLYGGRSDAVDHGAAAPSQ